MVYEDAKAVKAVSANTDLIPAITKKTAIYKSDCTKLFSLYINELIAGLSSKRIGCWIDGICVNNLSYADDMVLLGPTANAIRELLDYCTKYAASHGLLYNSKKSVFMIFKGVSKKISLEPVITLNGQVIQKVTQFKYLGHCVTDDLGDHADIERERRALAVRANMLARRFARISKEVKVTLFKAYCQTFYTSSLWFSYTRGVLDKLRIQYNNGFRMLLGLPRFCSASNMFAQHHTHDFYAMIRLKTASLLQRARSSSNGILEMLTNKLDSPIMQHFMQILVRQE
ncbi:uncharacterized protein LOC113498213 [Trichoplusia ni]|uniref:Uncharacterized protein LOC113498213 n=1 Tax=Trichoplusia ni TaxID=7111 RepID=A0A7E5W094_TRINI|nr:uncharacterized protein LOC113498213 [Trichoplusia ni]